MIFLPPVTSSNHIFRSFSQPMFLFFSTKIIIVYSVNRKKTRKWDNESCYSMNCEPFLVGFQSEEINDKLLLWDLFCSCPPCGRLLLCSRIHKQYFNPRQSLICDQENSELGGGANLTTD